ncbi:MAG: TVP38/TMEM64 family protein [Eubacteriaceae bacterium]
MSKKKTITFFIIILICIFFVVYASNSGQLADISNKLKSVEGLKNYLLSFGLLTPIIFFVIQTLQVVIAPIPGNITGLVSGGLFGIFFGFILSGSAIILGSTIDFYLARRYGKPLVKRIIKESTLEKYEKKSHGRFGKGLFVVFLIPFVPDDILCFIAGLSKMDYKLFFIMLLLGRMPGTLITVLIGAGSINNDYKTIGISLTIYIILIFIMFKYNSKFKDLIE